MTADELASLIHGEIAERDGRLTSLQGSLGVALAEIERLKALIPDEEPPPPPVSSTSFGACVLTTIPAVLDKYGPKASIRWFDASRGFSNVPQRPATASRFHASWKATRLPLYDELVLAFRNLQDGDLVTLNHEIDVKHKQGRISDLAEQRALIEGFHDDVDYLRMSGRIPQVQTCHVLAGWRFSGGNESPDPYYVPADVLGVDLDGANNRTRQPDYLDWTTPFIANIQRFAQRYNGRWTVPEYGERLLDNDPTGTRRLAAIKAQIPRLVAAGAEDILWFDQESVAEWKGYPLRSEGEIAEWRRLCASNP